MHTDTATLTFAAARAAAFVLLLPSTAFSGCPAGLLPSAAPTSTSVVVTVRVTAITDAVGLKHATTHADCSRLLSTARAGCVPPVPVAAA